MPKTRQDDLTPGQIEPTFHWETRIPHTVVLMLKSTEEDLILKACQSLYKFAHEGELNQNILIQYDVLALLLDHLEHTNRNVRRMAAMTLSELSVNLSVQSVLVSPDNVVRLVRVLMNDNDCVVDEVASCALLRLGSDAAGRAMLLRTDAVEALVKRLTSKDPDVLKTCLDTLLVVLDFPEAVEKFVQGGGVPNALDLVESEYPVLQTLALTTLKKAMSSVDGRVQMREAGGLERLITVLENGRLDDLHSNTVAVLDGAIHDADNIRAIHEFNGLEKILVFVQTTTILDVLEQSAFLLAQMAQHPDIRDIFHELSVEPVLVTNLLETGHAGSQNGAARAVGHMCKKLESQEELVRLGVVSLLLHMVTSPETFQSAVVALAAATRNHQLACRQICSSDHLERLVSRLGIPDDETVSHTAITLKNMSEQETVRPVVAAGSAPQQLVSCLTSDSPICLVAACEALAVLCLNLSARSQVVNHGGSELFMQLLEHPSAPVRDACVATLQVIGSDFTAAEQLSSGGAVGSLRALKATSTLRIILEVNLSALYSIFGRLSVRHKLYDLFFDCGRQETCTAVPSLSTVMTEPLSRTRTIYLIHSGICPYRSDDHPKKALNKEEHTEDEEQPKEEAPTQPDQLITQRLSEPEEKAKIEDEKKATKEESKKDESEISKDQQEETNTEDDHTQAAGKEENAPAPSEKDKKTESVHPQVKHSDSVSVAQCDDMGSSWEGTAQKDEEIVPPPDARLAGFVEHAIQHVKPLELDREQSSALAKFVSDMLGGSVPREHFGTWSMEAHICMLKRQKQCNVINVGDIRRGGLQCRALLFKFLADQIGLPCTLNRGVGGRHWNTVLLRGEGQLALLEPYLDTVVDLMHEPGRLMSADSAEGVEYTRGFSSH